ncbi:hypothetical protein QCA50_003460 [Cerrena zonata]|uniref:Uncharacterized protein n=1 Tax=Cerrena zonata TaxID=2478898 RepID=A0AAW0GPR2_9APHY
MYDLQSHSPASAHSSLHSVQQRAKRRHQSRRSHSPVPRISTLLPHHGSSQYSPSSRADDISRLLDPAYSSASSSSTAASPSRAYVDHRGDLHDPDYRDFPVLRSKTTTKQRRTSQGSSRSLSVPRDGYSNYSSYRYSSNQYSMAATPTGVRPEWERDWAVEGDDEDGDDDIEDDETFSSHSHFSRLVPEPKTRLFTPHNYSPPRWFGEPTPLSSSPVSLNDDDDNALQLVSSPFEGTPLDSALERDGEDEDRPTKSRIHHRLISGRSASKQEKERRNSADAEKARDDHHPSEHDEHLDVDDHDFVPSCTHSLRRQWQAVTLRFRFNVFHIKQRIRRTFN